MISGRVWKFGDDINTDLILPGPYLRESIEEQAKHVFEANRPGWIQGVTDGDVLVAGTNFGMGSARPAARSLRNLKLGFLVADQINSLFLRQCVNFGFIALDCPGVTGLFEEGDLAQFDPEAWFLRNARTGKGLSPHAVPAEFFEMMRNGGIYPMLEAEGLIAEAGAETY